MHAQIIAHQAAKHAKAASDTKQLSASAPAKKKRKAAAQEDEQDADKEGYEADQHPKPKSQPRSSNTIDKVKRICKAATVKIPPSMYVKSKSLAEVEADMEGLLRKHGLSLESSPHDISKAAARADILPAVT